MSEKAREERLKVALRENLRKRKAQARQRSAGDENDAEAPALQKDGGGAATPAPKAPE
jgi:hypothetical protein